MPAGRETCAKCGASLRPDQESCPLCGTPRPTGNQADVDDSVRRFASGRGRSAKTWTRRWIVLTAILEVAIIVFFAGVFTDWFGLTATSPTTAGGLQGADPNPHSEKVTSVALAMSYVGSLSGYFTIRPSGNACVQCPVLPAVDIRFGAPIADLLVYFNLTNTGSSYHEVTSWNVTTLNYAGSNPFSVRAVLCCYPAYLESAELAGLNPSQTLGFAILIQAASLPSNGGAGFSLLFTAVASD